MTSQKQLYCAYVRGAFLQGAFYVAIARYSEWCVHLALCWLDLRNAPTWQANRSNIVEVG